MRVLVACEFSGVVRDAFAARGHDAWSCDLRPTLAPGNHLQCDVLGVLDQGWDLMVAHPPCTHLALSANRWLGGRRRETREAVDFAVALMEAPIPRVAVENPTGVLSTAVAKPDQVIQPYDFGDNASKKTCLWLWGLPQLRPTLRIAPRLVCCGRVLPNEITGMLCPVCNGFFKPVQRWGNQLDVGNDNTPNTKRRSEIRSITYPGIAAAMASQWG